MTFQNNTLIEQLQREIVRSRKLLLLKSKNINDVPRIQLNWINVNTIYLLNTLSRY